MSEFIAEAQVAIVPNAADFAISLKKQVEAAIATVGPVVIPVAAAVSPISGAATAGAAAATSTLLASQKDLQESSLGLQSTEKVLNSEFARQAVILDIDAAAHEAAGVAAVKNAAAQRKTAVATGQATRAIEAQAASALGLRGTALTASSAFIATTVAVLAFGKSIKAASDETEELNKSAVVFGQSSDEKSLPNDPDKPARVSGHV